MRGARYKRVDRARRTLEGKTYDSTKEMRRAQQLNIMASLGYISDLREQVVFELIPKQKGERKCEYRADFVYVENGAQIVEDVKGHKTEIYRLKRKLMKHVLGITIREV